MVNEDVEANDSFLESSTLPLKGVIICGTSLDQHLKRNLDTLGKELGAVHSLELNLQVTHLLVGDPASEKFRHTVKHRPDLIVLKPSWFEAVRKAFNSGDDVNLQEINEQHRYKAFEGLNVCVTGITDLQERDAIQEGVNRSGGEYHADLTKAVTHLIALSPSGPKYVRALQWGITIVSPKWYYDSLQRGLGLDETLFKPTIPIEQQGKGSFCPIDKTKYATVGTKRGCEVGEDGSERRKLRRTASTRLNSQSQQVWESIDTHEELARTEEDNGWAQVENQMPAEQRSRIKKADSFHDDAIEEQISGQGIFSGYLCHPFGHDKRRALMIQEHVTKNGGVVVDSHNDIFTESSVQPVLIVSSSLTGHNDLEIPNVPVSTWIVSEWWIQRSIAQQSALDPKSDVLSQSFHNLPRDCFKDLIISVAGFGDDALLVSRLIQAAGAVYKESLSRENNLLVWNYSAPGTSLDKAAYCTKREIDITTPDWFLASLARRTRQNIDDYELPMNKCEEIRLYNEQQNEDDEEKKGRNARRDSASSPGHRRLSGKGTGRRHQLQMKTHTKTTIPLIHDTQKTLPLTRITSNSQERQHSQRSFTMDLPELVTSNVKSNDVETENIPPETMTDIGPPDMLTDSNKALEDLLTMRRQNSGPDRVYNIPKKRLLHRNLSGNGNASFTKPSIVHNPFIHDDENEDIGAGLDQLAQPSQILTYEIPTADGKRRAYEDDEDGVGQRVQSLGTLRDADSGIGVGNRVRSKRQ